MLITIFFQQLPNGPSFDSNFPMYLLLLLTNSSRSQKLSLVDQLVVVVKLVSDFNQV